MEEKPLYQDLSRFLVPSEFRGRSKFVVQLWWIVQETLFKWSPQILYPWRAALLRIFGAKIGPSSKIRATAHITYPWNLVIGSNSWVGDESVLYNLAPISIGDNVAIAHRVYLCTGFHHLNVITFDIDAKPINVANEVWLSNDVFVGSGVTIGQGAVIGARSSVFADMPAGMVCFGYPCKPVKQRVMAASPL